MPRKARNNITSKFVHVISQGINKEYIFEKEEYKREYIKLLSKAIQEYQDTKILAYCIMDNHVHLLIYIVKIKELSKIMSKVNTAYGIFYNNKENRVGYVFRSRYYSQEIMEEKQLFNTISYIHRNPVKAGIVKKESEYKYSSYNCFIRKQFDNDTIKLIFNSDDYLEQFFYIHENYSEENILEIREEQEKAEEKMKRIIIKFCKEYNSNIEHIKKDRYLLKLLVNEIKSNSDVTNKVIANYIIVGKNRITELLKER